MARIVFVWSHSMASQGMSDEDWLSKKDSLMYSLTKLAEDGYDISVHALTEDESTRIMGREGYQIVLHPVDVKKRRYGEQTSRSLLSTLESLSPDIVYLNSLNMVMNHILVHKLTPRAYILRAHGKFIHDFLVEEVHALEVSNEYQRIGAMRTFMISPDAIWINPFGADTSLFTPDWTATKEYDVVYVGRLVRGKNIELLLKSFRHVHGNMLLIGKGREEEYYRKMAKKLGIEHRVTFAGWIDNAEIPHYLNRSKVFVMPSLSEGGGRSLAEAMACGIPVIAMKGSVGSESYVDDGCTGYVIRPGELVDTLESLIHDERKLREFGKKGQEVALKLYSHVGFYERLKSLIENMLESKPKRTRSVKGVAFRVKRLFRPNYWLAVRNKVKAGRRERIFLYENMTANI